MFLLDVFDLHASMIQCHGQPVLECFCGRIFEHLNAYGNHRRSCRQTKKRVSDVLDKAKERFAARKKQKVSQIPSTPTTSTALHLAESLIQAEVRAILFLTQYHADCYLGAD
jgi:hypothetical protein